MKPVWIKICANTNLADAQLAAELGADAVGFVFAPSKRQVTARQVAAITAYLPSSLGKVGVFATSDVPEIVGAVEQAALTAVQLHGAVDAERLERLSGRLPAGVEIIQTVAYEADAAERPAADAHFRERLLLAMTHPAVSRVLLDTAKAGASGGLGIAFDWEHAAALLGEAVNAAGSPRSELPPIVLAGGLRADNVQAAIAALRPGGVDVASGVEAQPGRKNPALLRAFLAAARQAVKISDGGRTP